MHGFQLTGKRFQPICVLLAWMVLTSILSIPSEAADDFYIPETLIFCGDPVPLDSSDVRERLEVQLRVYAHNTAQVKLWAMRRARFFPIIEPILAKHKMPDDLKYVPVIESSLLNRAVSPKSAMGPWQFIPGTGRNNGLRVNQHIDERVDTEKSTRAAIRYLSGLYEEFGSWPTSLAAYNIGENRIRRESYRQGTSSYYEMLLPNETDRYVFNILAAKIIFENSDRYGIKLDNLDSFKDIESVPVAANLTRSVPAKILAYCSGLSYRDFRSINPWIIGVDLPAGKYQIKVPVKQREGFESRLHAYFSKVKNLVKLRNKTRLEIKSEIGEMRIAPSTEYPVFRELKKGENFAVRWRTQNKDRSHYWYLFKRKDGSSGWIWGGQVKL